MSRLRIAIQKSGRLSEDSLALLSKAGIKSRIRSQDLICHCDNFPLDILRVRDDDIPRLLNDGVCDYGIVGTNVLTEASISNTQFTIINKLGFGQCRLSIALPKEANVKDIANKRIATSYPNLLKSYLTSNNLDAEIINLSGSVELAPRLGLADAICDLVSTGATLAANQLEEIFSIFQSEAVLVRRSLTNNEMRPNYQRFEQRIQGVLTAGESKYIMLHVANRALDDVIALLPGAEKPTIVPLDSKSKTSVVHAVCRETIFWETLESLKSVGASSILVMPVEKMMA